MAMTTMRMVVQNIEPDPNNVVGGRSITVVGISTNGAPAHCVLTFKDAAAFDQLRKAIDQP